MDSLKKALVYWNKLRNNEIDHGDILTYRLIPIMSKFLLWWTEEDYKKTPKWAKIIYVLLAIRIFTCTALSLLYLGLHWDSKPVHLVLEDVAVSMGGFVGSCGTIIFPYYRKRSSDLLRTINETNLNILKRSQNGLENRRTSNRLFLAMFVLSTAFEIMSVMSFLLFAWEFVNSGLPKLNSFLYPPQPYSAMAYIDGLTYLCSGFWMMSLSSFYLSMYIEFILRISFHFRVLAEDMRQLRKGVDFDEEEHLQKLKTLIKELNSLHWCVDEYNETLRFYMIGFFWLSFTTLGIYAAVILSMGSILKSWQIVFFPIYLFLFNVSFCAIGQHLKDSIQRKRKVQLTYEVYNMLQADEVRVGIYDCDWYSAPFPFRKLVLNVLTRCTKDTLFSANPFYDVDLLLLTRVLKTTYTLIAVFGKAIK